MKKKKNASRMTRELNERGAGYNLGKWTKAILLPVLARYTSSPRGG